MRTHSFQTFTGEKQRRFLDPETLPFDYYDNKGTEFEIFKKIREEHSSSLDAWGIFSWKFEIKTLTELKMFNSFAVKGLKEGADCVFINPMLASEAVFANVWEQGELCGHGGIQLVTEFLVQKGLITVESLFMQRTTFALCNYFYATKKFWQGYIEYVEECLNELDKDWKAGGEVGKIYSSSARYGRRPNLSMRPFIIERLFSSYLDISKFWAVPYQYEEKTYQEKFGIVFGKTLWELSAIKNLITKGKPTDQKFEIWKDYTHNLLKSGLVFNMITLDDPEPELVDNAIKLRTFRSLH